MRAIVIGGTGVVGEAACRELAARGTRVAFTFHGAEERARALAEAIDAPSARLDLLRPSELGPVLGALVDRLGGLDALVYCAGRASIADPPRADALEELDEAGWDRLMAVNVRGAAFAVKVLAPRFGEPGGNVVLVGSIDGLKPVPTPIPYATSKAALLGLAPALAKELGARRIRVNVVAPGLLDAGAGLALPAALREDYVAHTALGRFGTAGELARTIAWLALENTYLTGRAITVDGGL